jgi:hypothetical protein
MEFDRQALIESIMKKHELGRVRCKRWYELHKEEHLNKLKDQRELKKKERMLNPTEKPLRCENNPGKKRGRKPKTTFTDEELMRLVA